MEQCVAQRTLRRLDIQGFDSVPEAQLAEIVPWNRMAFGLCVSITLVGTILASPTILWALVPIAFLGAVFPVHPFDLIYNYGVRHLRGTGPMPRRGAPARFACTLATPWLAAAGWCFYAGYATAGYILGFLLFAVGGLVSTTDICIPSIIFRAIVGPPKAREGS